jgi:small subunit ribosomal protein S5
VSEENKQQIVETAPVETQSAPPAEQSSGRGEGRGQRGPRGPRRSRPPEGRPSDKDGDEMAEKVVFINRSSKVVKGGRRFSFSALVVAGDRKGKIGVGLGKSGEVSEAIKKGGENAKTRMISVSIEGSTIPHAAYATFCGAKILLRPASPGTGLIAGKTVRAVLESVGIKDVLTKSLGSNNAANVVKATVCALRQLARREDIYKRRGLELKKRESAPAPVQV